MSPEFKPACFFSPSETQEPEDIFEKRILDVLKSQYPVYLTRDNLQYSLNYLDAIRTNKAIVSLEKKELIKRITIFHYIDGRSIIFNGYQFILK